MYLQAILAEKYTLKNKESDLRRKIKKKSYAKSCWAKFTKTGAKLQKDRTYLCTQWIWHQTGLVENQLTEHMPQD
jgi:hypothetical protein